MSVGGQDDSVARKEVLDLFKMYEDKGWAVKQQVITIVTWLSPVIFGLIAFSIKDYCSASGARTTNLAISTALALSIFMSLVIYGSLRHSNRDYEKADKLLRELKVKDPYPQHVYETIKEGQPEPSFFRLGLPRIGGVHIFIMYLSFFLVGLSLVLLAPPRSLLPTLCPGGPRASMPIENRLAESETAYAPAAGVLHDRCCVLDAEG
jgi:hypothetical protein